MIDIEFFGNKKYRDVKKAWRSYLHVRINQPPVTSEAEKIQFAKACEDTLTDLLVKMGDSLGYEFDETHIKQSIYKPQGHVLEENYQMFIREKIVQLFLGNLLLPMDIKSLPLDQTEIAEQKKLRELAIKFLEKNLSEQKSQELISEKSP